MYPIIIPHAKRYKRDDWLFTSFFADEKSLVGARVGFFGKNLSNILSLYEVGEKDGTNSKLGDLVGFRLCGDNVVFTKQVGFMLGVKLIGVTVCGIAEGVIVGMGLGGSVPIAVGLSVGTVGLRVRTVGLGDGCDVGLFEFGFGLGIRLGLLVGDAVIIE